MKTTPGMLLACGLLLATALPVAAQDEELPPPPPLTSIPDAQFCALVTDDLVTCEGVLTELGESNILPASFAAVAEALAAGAAADAIEEATAGAGRAR